MHGLFTRLHLANSRKFRSEALRRGCEQHNIAIDYRPVHTPHYGGHIERLIGTMMARFSSCTPA
jgi:putative transposase